MALMHDACRFKKQAYGTNFLFSFNQMLYMYMKISKNRLLCFSNDEKNVTGHLFIV